MSKEITLTITVDVNAEDGLKCGELCRKEFNDNSESTCMWQCGIFPEIDEYDGGSLYTEAGNLTHADLRGGLRCQACLNAEVK